MSLDTDFFVDASTPLTDYTQTAVLQTSQTIAVPAGTRYIEALLCGGGDGGGATEPTRGGAFGGVAVFAIPVLGAPLVLTVGAGGAAGQRGGATTVTVNGMVYAAVGSGYPGKPGEIIRAIREPLWSATAPDGSNALGGTGGVTNAGVVTPAGVAGLGAGGGYMLTSTPGANSSAGGSLAGTSIWGMTGFAGGSGAAAGTSSAAGGGGGGGMLAAGAAGTSGSGYIGGAGGNGGGGGGGGATNANRGAGGLGFGRFRFYR